MHVLIVEDDALIAENLFDFLEARGHRCDYAHTLAAARLLLGQATFDALVLDRNLPDGDGATLARQLRAAGMATPILMLTARDALADKLAGFDAGADDYLGKPFALKEVEVRLLALQRRSGAWAAPGRLAWGGLTYEPAARSATLDGAPLPLPPKALRLLEVLLQQPERVYSRRELETAVWGSEQDSSDNLRSVLLTLRKALAAQPALTVENVHGLGYKLTRSS
jgi:DNA-binding response OmpR family regulator